MLSSHGALLRFSLLIDALTSDGIMDGGSMVEVVVRSYGSLDQLKLFLIHTVFHRIQHISSLFGLYHDCASYLIP